MTCRDRRLACTPPRSSLVALGLVATQAALFGPSKYGLLPELLPAKRLSWGNGVIELGTFLAIIVGTVTGAAMAEHFRGHEVYAGYALLALAADRTRHQLRHRPRSRRCAGKEVSLQHRRRPLAADQADAPRPAALSRCSRQHLLLVSRLAALLHHRRLRARRAAHRPDQNRLPERQHSPSASASAA